MPNGRLVRACVCVSCQFSVAATQALQPSPPSLSRIRTSPAQSDPPHDGQIYGLLYLAPHEAVRVFKVREQVERKR